MVVTTRYKAPWWLPGSHLQTLYPYFMLRSQAPAYRREQIDTPDGDFLDLDWIDAQPGSPTFVLFHGLEGCSRSHYATSLMHAVAARQWRGVVVHFRGCGGEPNRLPRAYHSGDADEIDWILRQIHQRHGAPLFASGISLGGNALLKWLARESQSAHCLLSAATAVSPPMDLMTAGSRLSNGLCWFYGRHFLSTLKPKALEKLRRFPGLAESERVRLARSLRAFDDVFTAPIHGFRDVNDYWTRASSIGDLDNIVVPTLIVHARNDPFLPGRYLPVAQVRNKAIEFEFPDKGGHVGFVTGPFPGNLAWLPERILAFMEHRLAAQPTTHRNANQ